MNYDFRKDAEEFFDAEDMFGQWRNPIARTTNNALLYSGTYYTILVMLGLARSPDLERFNKMCRSCEVPVNGVPQPGLYFRHPNHSDMKQEHDDYVGMAAAAYHLDSPIAKEIVKYGRDNDWYYDSLHLTVKDPAKWHSRFGNIVPHYKACAKEVLGLVDQVFWALPTIFGAFGKKDNSSGIILDWLKIAPVDGKYFICNIAIMIWRWRMRKAFPKGMADVFAIYFQNDGGYDHPFSKATVGIL